MDPIKLHAILNKKPREVVTADEWNEILTLLITQANAFSDTLAGFEKTIKSILDGEISDIVVNTNVTHFGGKTPEEYTTDVELETKAQQLTNYFNTALSGKQPAIYLTPNRIVVSNSAGQLTATDINHNVLYGLTGNIQTQLNGKASAAHNHDGIYASSSHGHSNYSTTDHNHDGRYASASHGHDSVNWANSANNSSKVNWKNIFVQQGQPSPENTGDIWISW